MKVFYRLHFRGPFIWERVEESDGRSSSTFCMSDATKESLTLTPEAACGLLGAHDRYRIPGTRQDSCVRCGRKL